MYTVLYVGFQVPTCDVDENDGEGFVCVEVVDTSPLLSDLRVRISTSDGTALGMIIIIILYAITT